MVPVSCLDPVYSVNLYVDVDHVRGKYGDAAAAADAQVRIVQSSARRRSGESGAVAVAGVRCAVCGSKLVSKISARNRTPKIVSIVGLTEKARKLMDDPTQLL